MNEHVDCILGYFDAIASFLCRVCFFYTLIYLLSLGGVEGGVALSGIRASLSVCQFVSCLSVVCLCQSVLGLLLRWLLLVCCVTVGCCRGHFANHGFSVIGYVQKWLVEMMPL